MSDAEKPVVKSKRKLKPGMGKAKGSGFESLIAKKLSAALPINFIRSPGSGARVGGKNFATIGAMMGEEALKLFNADVVPVNEAAVGLRFSFSIECKSYATADNFTSLVSGSANVFKWFEEAVIDSAKIGREPILVFKWNRSPIFVAVLARTMEGMVTPALRIGRAGRDLDVYEFDELIKHPDFWVQPA
ncbi:hypothetical protein [Acinetobacter sp.]|uniref:putative PDDEXK endonuclease n=1 Tax=Acinetobacter sp. TaxID=472 RepID=UPI00388D0BEF